MGKTVPCVHTPLINFPSEALNFSIISMINNVVSSVLHQLRQLTDLMLPRRLFFEIYNGRQKGKLIYIKLWKKI